MRMFDVIKKKIDGLELTKDEINFFVDGYCKDIIPDYQVSALLTAMYINKLTESETFWLTKAMINSGDIIDLSGIDGIKVDKHSTGGVGDKTTLVIVPLASACGLKIAKMSGRGLGHTGGTLDKLESIPGFNIMLSTDEIIKFANTTGACIAGQTANLVPADKKLYSLRDVTATVDNISLIASSIMSKKIASGADVIVLDVKYGSGAFMKTPEQAKKLALEMIQIGKAMNRKVSAMITNMDMPLGNNIGNALEVIEAIEVLKRGGPEDLRQLAVEAVRLMLTASFNCSNSDADQIINDSLKSGKALNVFRQIILNQNGDERVVEDYNLFGTATIKHTIKSNKRGYVKSIQTDSLGIASMMLGAGREKKEDIIDYTAGIIVFKKIGDFVEEGDVLVEIYTNDTKNIIAAENIIHKAYDFSELEIKPEPLIYDILR